MIVLALDTSTPAVTAGVIRVRRPHELIAEPKAAPTETLAERTVVNAFAHAEQLMPLTRTALAEASLALADVEAVVVGLGPGPFTGLRVGISTAAALGDALDIPVHGIPSHDGLAAAVGSGADGRALLVVTDARRREVYASGYRGGQRRFGPAVLPAAALPEALAEAGLRPDALVGSGTDLVAGVPGLAGLPVLPPSGSLPGGLVHRALSALLTGTVPGPLVPLYLRRPDATEPPARRINQPA